MNDVYFFCLQLSFWVAHAVSHVSQTSYVELWSDPPRFGAECKCHQLHAFKFEEMWRCGARTARAIKHFQEALDLARTSGHNDLMKCIIKSLGSAHSEKANQLFIRLQEFWELSPEFKKGLCEVQGHKSNIRLEQEKKCGSSRHLHLHSLTVEQGEVSHAVDQGLKGSSKLNWSGRRQC